VAASGAGAVMLASSAAAAATMSTSARAPARNGEYDVVIVGGGIVGLATAREIMFR
jgi:hypothetical protein